MATEGVKNTALILWRRDRGLRSAKDGRNGAAMVIQVCDEDDEGGICKVPCALACAQHLQIDQYCSHVTDRARVADELISV
jgi:hypothetical protein